MYASHDIPFLDLVTPHVELEARTDGAYFGRALHTAGFVGGPVVEDFERLLRRFANVSHAVAVSSGTDALALRHHGLRNRRPVMWL